MTVTNWRTSTHSGTHQCVEVGRLGNHAAVRDTKNRAAGYLTATSTQWRSFIAAIKTGRYEK